MIHITLFSLVKQLTSRPSFKVDSHNHQVLRENNMQTIYFADGCLRGVQAFVKTLPGVVATEAGRANGVTGRLEGPHDGYAER